MFVLHLHFFVKLCINVSENKKRKVKSRRGDGFPHNNLNVCMLFTSEMFANPEISR